MSGAGTDDGDGSDSESTPTAEEDAGHRDATPTVDEVRERLRAVVDPCTAATGSNLDVVEMGLVEDVTVARGSVHVDLRLTTPACHMVPYFIEEIESRLAPLPGVDAVSVDTDAGMSWTPSMMTDAAREKRERTLDRYETDLQRADADAE